MSKPVLTFFNNKGGVGKTSLVYHLTWMLAELGYTVLAADLDPQANLTAAFLEESELEAIWQDATPDRGATIYRCVAPLARVGDVLPPMLKQVQERLWLLPGDLALSVFEDRLSSEWPNALGTSDLYRPFRVLTAFWQVLQLGATECGADFIFVDVGPSLGAINRSALIATDYLIVPLGADLFSLQGLRNLGPTLRGWRTEWQKRLDNWNPPEFELPQGKMLPLGYMVQQHSIRLSRPVLAYDRWISRMPAEYARSVLGRANTDADSNPEDDPNRIATLKHYRSLVPLAQDARKPIFRLTAADGALGSHALAAQEARKDFAQMAQEILRRIEAQEHNNK